MGKDYEKLVGQVVASGMLQTKAERQKVKEAAAQARREERRRAKEAAAERERIEIWTDRDGKSRPTPQRRLKGVFRLRDTDDAGVSVAVDAASCVVDQLAALEAITPRQKEAGHEFEAVARGVLGSPAGRSCVDFSPVGHDTDDDDDAAVAAKRRWDSLRRMIRPDDRRELIRVCWEKRRPESMARLRRGLDGVGDWLGLEK